MPGLRFVTSVAVLSAAVFHAEAKKNKSGNKYGAAKYGGGKSEIPDGYVAVGNGAIRYTRRGKGSGSGSGSKGSKRGGNYGYQNKSKSKSKSGSRGKKYGGNKKKRYNPVTTLPTGPVVHPAPKTEYGTDGDAVVPADRTAPPKYIAPVEPATDDTVTADADAANVETPCPPEEHVGNAEGEKYAENAYKAGAACTIETSVVSLLSASVAVFFLLQ